MSFIKTIIDNTPTRGGSNEGDDDLYDEGSPFEENSSSDDSAKDDSNTDGDEGADDSEE